MNDPPAHQVRAASPLGKPIALPSQADAAHHSPAPAAAIAMHTPAGCVAQAFDNEPSARWAKAVVMPHVGHA